MSKKKVVGFSFGKKMGKTEIMIKEALLECEKAGMDIQFIRCDELNIRHCRGCNACVMQLGRMVGPGKCVFDDKDDFHIIHEALLSADGVIVGSPTFELAPTGLFKTVADRIGPSHDITFIKPAIEDGKAKGKPVETYPDERFLKPRVGALVSVGGAMTKNWLAFNMPGLFQFTFSMGIDVIDKCELVGGMEYDSALGREDIMARMRKLGQNIVDALNAETEEERTRYRADDRMGTCPVCHEDMLIISHDGTKVECPVCGIEGNLSVVDGQIKVDFSAEQQARSRLREAGKWEHSNEIRHGMVSMKRVENLKERLKKYEHVGE